MAEKIMFVGAGVYQLRGIEKAKAMGLSVIATDGDDRAPGLRVADKGHVVDVRDVEKHIVLARATGIDGVLAIAAEASLRTVAAICRSLALPGVSPEVVEIATDKVLMRRAFVENGLPSPQSIAASSEPEAVTAIKAIGLPVVVKPADSAGSRGVSLVRRAEETSTAYAAARSFATGGKVVVEEFMAGTEASVEAFVDGGDIHILAMSDKIRTEPPYLLDIEVIFPFAGDESLCERVINIAKLAIDAVGIDRGPVHVEIMLTPEGPVPVELAARGPGFKIFTDVIPMITGVDTMSASIDVALGKRPRLDSDRSLASSILFLDSPAGLVKEVSGVEEARRLPGVYDLAIYVEAGDPISSLTSGSDRVGHVISLADTRAEARDITRRAAELILIRVDSQENV